MFYYYLFFNNRWLTSHIGVSAIPLSAFNSQPTKYLVSNLIRFCICKLDSTLDEAGVRLLKLRNYLKSDGQTNQADNM